MTNFAITLPLDRTSPLHIPTRDLVLGGTDSVSLLVSVVECDSPDALPIDLSGGLGGPTVSLFVWPDSHRHGYGGWGGYGGGWGGCHDYGWGWHGGGIAGPGTVLWSATSTIYNVATGTFAIAIPAGTMGTWPRRCRWAIFLDADGGGEAELLAEGHLHVRPMVSRGVSPVIMLTDPAQPVMTDDAGNVILLDGITL